MKRQMNLFFKLVIISLLILSVGRYLANLIFDDPATAERMVKMTFIVALFIVPVRHFRMNRQSKRK